MNNIKPKQCVPKIVGHRSYGHWFVQETPTSGTAVCMVKKKWKIYTMVSILVELKVCMNSEIPVAKFQMKLFVGLRVCLSSVGLGSIQLLIQLKLPQFFTRYVVLALPDYKSYSMFSTHWQHVGVYFFYFNISTGLKSSHFLLKKYFYVQVQFSFPHTYTSVIWLPSSSCFTWVCSIEMTARVLNYFSPQHFHNSRWAARGGGLL